MNYLRKKLQGIMTCSDFEGYLRTISGAPPLTLPYSLGKDITSLTLTGNAVQNGTPSPDNPVEIYGVGERTINLLDVSQFESNSGGYVENGEVYVTGYPYQPGITPEKFLAMTGLKEGDTFTTYGDLEYFGTGTGALHIVFYLRPAGTEAGKPSFILNNHGNAYTLTIPEGFNSTNYNNLYIYADGVTDSGLRGIWRNLMIVKGAPDEPPPYEPYGYKIPVKFTSDNGDTQTINVFTNSPLYTIGDVGDTIEMDFDAKTAVRTNRTILSEFDEDTAWAYNGSEISTYSCIFNTSVTPARETYSAVICNRFKKINTTELSSADKESGVYEGGAINYVINHNLIGVTAGMTTTEAISMWKSWLSGKTIKVLYQLAAPTTTDISSMQNWEASAAIPRGTLTVTTETDVQPAYISADYYSMKKE